MNLNTLLQEASAATPDRERALRNLTRLSDTWPEFTEEHVMDLEIIAGLFSYSQFLAEYSIKKPLSLSRALRNRPIIPDKEVILAEASGHYHSLQNDEFPPGHKEKSLKLLREIKNDFLLLITVRDISGITNLNECMSELSILAEAILELALDISFTLMRKKFGLLRENAFSVIGMGKLGAKELNYSSDIDIITVYRSDESISTGILNPFGIRHNKISAQEYFSVLTETLAHLLQVPTEDGIAYRVDLRLRPNGQKGSLSLSIDSYRAYYESWGKTWEKIALVRARPVAGDQVLGSLFLSATEPFVWKKSLDYHEIEEIKELKKKIDAIGDINDIKRGYGGIREIEFFVQTFQLLYGGEKRNLRAQNLETVLRELCSEGFLSVEDAQVLWEGYAFLRRIEHLLQMKEDMQTYSLPANDAETDILAKKMGLPSAEVFQLNLRLKRLKVRDMYNALLGGTEAVREPLLSLRNELPEDALKDYLTFRGFRRPDAALRQIDTLLEVLSSGKTMRERTLLGKTVPLFLEQALKSVNKDGALWMVVSLIQKIGTHESYIDFLLQRPDVREMIVTVSSLSSYLSRLMLSLDNLEGIFEYPSPGKDYAAMQDRLTAVLKTASDPLASIRGMKMNEELQSGMLYLSGFLDRDDFSKSLTSLAETMIKALISYLGMNEGFAVIGLGAFGAYELNIGSDLDLLFVHEKTTSRPVSGQRAGEELIRMLSSYTEQGFAYRIDMRLRPDGSKGILANDLNRYKRYYLKSAEPWEIQSLLRARPVAGSEDLSERFRSLQHQIIKTRAAEISGSAMRKIRKRIIREIARESDGYDLKNGPGGIKEIEFLIQFLQLKHVIRYQELLTENTITALERLKQLAILNGSQADFLLDSYRFMKTLDTLLRLNDTTVLKTNSEITDIIIKFLRIASGDELIRKIRETRKKVIDLTEKCYG